MSKVDLSLDEIVTMGKRRGRGGGPPFRASAGKPWGPGKKPGFPAVRGPVGGKAGDLRDVLASKQKKQVVDLRAKLKPRGGPPQRGRARPVQRGRMVPGSPPQRNRSRSPIQKRANPAPPAARPVMRRRRESPVRLPSQAEAKKITVTVPGLSRPVSESSAYRREEHLAAAIARSKEARHDSYLRGREEVLAAAITSALSGTGMEREPPVGAGYNPRMRFNHSPPSNMDPSLSGYPSQHHPPPPPPPPPPLSRTKGITTMTTMTISNLSDTVSKNDISELCGAVGSLESVAMPAPGVAEVVFKYKDDALEAFKKYNQRNLDGQPMICKLQATSRGRAMAYGGGIRANYMDYGNDFSYSTNFY